MSAFTNLIGKRINGIFVDETRTELAFRTTEGRYLGYVTCGDCCNSVYINHFSGADVVGEGNSFDLLRGALVLAVEDKGWTEDREEGYEVVQEGFWTIKTDRGYIDLEVRNEHNGYYGGHIEEDEDADVTDLTELKEDF
jgi:hypothetical protein